MKQKFIARIQQKTHPDLTQPYPFFIEADGLVGRQEFWKGTPLKLLGFNNTTQEGEISLPFEEFTKNINAAIGKYPVFRDKDGTISTHINPVENVKI